MYMIDLIFLELVRDIEEKYNYIFPSNLVEHLSNISFRQKNEITYYGIILGKLVIMKFEGD